MIILLKSGIFRIDQNNLQVLFYFFKVSGSPLLIQMEMQIFLALIVTSWTYYRDGLS
jgi:hypothetical protein